MLLAAASEGLVSDQAFENRVRAAFPGIKDPDPLYRALRERILPESFHPASAEEKLALEFSFPLWLVKRWAVHFGLEEAKELLECSQARPPLVIRSNSLKVGRDELIRKLKRRGFEVSPTRESPYGILFKERANLFDTEEFRKGFFEIQDEGSQLVCLEMDPKPGGLVWDVCAGGGGKSLMLAALMKNKGRLIATDIRKGKLEELSRRSKRAGVTNIFPADLARLKESSAMKRGADKILVDAPCSGTGTLRRNPDAKWKLSESSFSIYHKDQTAIVENALGFLKKGGRLYYATCSLEPEENEEVVQEILARHPELKLIPRRTSGDGFFRLLPHRHPTDGFFLAVLQRAA